MAPYGAVPAAPASDAEAAVPLSREDGTNTRFPWKQVVLVVSTVAVVAITANTAGTRLGFGSLVEEIKIVSRSNKSYDRNAQCFNFGNENDLPCGRAYIPMLSAGIEVADQTKKCLYINPGQVSKLAPYISLPADGYTYCPHGASMPAGTQGSQCSPIVSVMEQERYFTKYGTGRFTVQRKKMLNLFKQGTCQGSPFDGNDQTANLVAKPSTLTIHLRDGDIWKPNRDLKYENIHHRLLTQQPCSWYGSLMEGFQNVVVVHEPLGGEKHAKSPCHDVVAKQAKGLGIPLQYQSGSLTGDVCILRKAHTLVLSKSAFTTAIMLQDTDTKILHVPNVNADDPFKLWTGAWGPWDTAGHLPWKQYLYTFPGFQGYKVNEYLSYPKEKIQMRQV